MAIKRNNGKALPNWVQLISELHEFARLENVNISSLDADISKAIQEGKLLIVAQEIEDHLPKETLNRFFRQIFLDTGVKPGDVHKQLVRIPFQGILTTNYDALIEGAYTLEMEGRIPPVFIQEDLEKIPNPLRTEDVFVFKIHGDIGRPDSIVLGSHEYQETLFRRPGYRSFLETLFTINTVLFLGFSLSDPDIDNMLDRLASIYSRTNELHYALIEKDRYSSLEKRRLALDKRIRVLEYDNDDGTHEQVFEFLTYLYELTDIEGELREEYDEKVQPIRLVQPAQKEKLGSIFISYSHKDKVFAERLISDLREEGVTVWYDHFNIRVGNSIISQIEEGIRSTDNMLVILSKNSVYSPSVLTELELANYKSFEMARPYIIPAILDDEALSNMPKYLEIIVYLDFRKDYDSAFQMLIDALKSRTR